MNHLTISGFLGADPELRYTASGRAVVSVRIADTPRTRNRQSGAWEDGTTLWLRASAWGGLAEHIASSVSKGDRVTASGRLTQRDYTDRTGQQRQVIELSIDDFAVSLARATVVVRRVSSRGQGGDPYASNSVNTGNASFASNASNAGIGSADAGTAGAVGGGPAGSSWGEPAVPGDGRAELDY